MDTRDTVHKFMLEYQKERGKPPTLEDIMDDVDGLNFKSSARHTVESLIRDGRVAVSSDAGKSRRYQAVEPPPIQPLSQSVWPNSGGNTFVLPHTTSKL